MKKNTLRPPDRPPIRRPPTNRPPDTAPPTGRRPVTRIAENLIFLLFLGSLLTLFLYSETSFFGFITERT